MDVPDARESAAVSARYSVPVRNPDGSITSADFEYHPGTHRAVMYTPNSTEGDNDGHAIVLLPVEGDRGLVSFVLEIDDRERDRVTVLLNRAELLALIAMARTIERETS